MKVVILHDRVTGASRPDEVDALQQAALVAGAFELLGHDVSTLALDLNLADLEATLQERAADLVFNLVESLGGRGRLIHVLPAVLEAIGIPFTGCGGSTMLLTTNKLLAKQWLHRAGIRTPAWHSGPFGSAFGLSFPCTCIVKPVWEDASVGISDDAVIEVSGASELEAALDRSWARFGEVFAEEFIEGREFNLSLLCDGNQPVVLPAAEIEFVGYPGGKPRIVGYPAKWEHGSFEYQATLRRFDLQGLDQQVLDELRTMALECWTLFEVRGYARVDFRVDAANRPWVLEVNANPCLARDAGFLAAAGCCGLSPEQVVHRIVEDALRPSSTWKPSDHASSYGTFPA